MAYDYSIGTTLKNEFLPSLNGQNPAKTGLIFAKRTLGTGNKLILPTGGEAIPNLYVPFYLGSYKDGLTALQQLKKMGFQYSLGLSYATTYIAPSSVVVNSGAGTVTLVWNSANMGIQSLIGQNPTGTVTQETSTASIRSVSIDGDYSYMTIVPVGASTFNTSDVISVNAIVDKACPNPDTSDNVCLAVWSYYQQYITSPNYTTSPDCYVSVSISGRDSSISPSATAISFVAPATATFSGSITYLTLSNTADNLGLLPTTPLGNSIVKQGSVTGTYAGYSLSGNNCVIKVTGATGAFTNSDAFTVELDPSQNGFSFIDNYEISSAALAFADVFTQAQLNGYPDFVAGIAKMTDANASKHKKYNFQGYFSARFTTPRQYTLANITAPDSTKYKASITLDINGPFQFTAPGINAVQNMYINLNNEFQFYATSGVGAIINQECSADITTYPSSLDADQLTSQGWTVFMPAQNGLRYIYNDVCCMQTDGGKVDYEYRYEATQLKVRWIDKNMVEVGNATCTNSDGTRKNNNPELVKTLESNLMAVLTEAYNNGNGIVGNTNNSVSIKLNSVDVSKFDVTLSTTIVSPNNGLNMVAVFTTYTL